RPVILLPQDWRDWDGPTLDAVLAHERSHIGRRDPLVQLLSALHRALLWYSPASWCLHSRIVRVAEEASDDAAVAAINDRAGYAELLLSFMQRGVRGGNWQGVPMARYGRPEDRVQRILDATSLTRGVTRAGIAAILAFGAPLTYVAAAARPQSAAATAQTPPAPDKMLTFDVASVKPFVPPPASGGGRKGGRGPSGPGTADPERVHYSAIRLKDLVIAAYNVKDFQIVGPAWLESTDETTRFVIDAKLPPGATKEQLQVMLQNLLAERFKLAIHRETRERSKYSLTVVRNGPKLKESAPYVPPPDAETVPRGGRGRSIDAYGFPVWQEPPEGGTWRFFINGRARLGARRATMQDLADELTTWQLRTPVTNDTGLQAKYDFILTFSVPDWHGQIMELPDGMGRLDPSVASEPLPDLFAAMQSELGLKLEPKKGPVDVIVIDHIERTPTAN
ncbi:MAG TPA: M56 and DUF3738 domain-containing protein, partial [Candidatus Acidoferrum sp.]|nr:M56 and DUF3738 domain-containing protein [Candidatus Acidoferrum sp.]